jgi:tRNA A37 threonylcarbamoyladenosine dehydratase
MPIDPAFERMALLIGEEGLAKLASQSVEIVGIGGVGSWAAEALARCGVGSFVLVDCDLIQESNINRQVHALASTLGRPKVEVMGERILDINPKARVDAVQEFFSGENGEALLRPGITFVVDAIDTLPSKVELIILAKRRGIPVISSMGAGNKLDPSRFELADLFRTSVCPLARAMRKELRARGVDSLEVVYSREEPLHPLAMGEGGGGGAGTVRERGGKKKIGSIAFVPSAAGLLLASAVVREILGNERRDYSP